MVGVLLAVLALVYLLGSLGVRVGPFLFSELPSFGLILAGVVGWMVTPPSPSALTLRDFAVSTILLLWIGFWPLSVWRDALTTPPSPLPASIHRLGDRPSLSDRTISIESLELESRNQLRRWTGRGENMVVEVVGVVQIPAAGRYRIHASCDDRCRLRIGGDTVVDQTGLGSTDVALSPGLSSFEFRYQQDRGPASFDLSWDRPAMVELVPIRHFVGSREELVTVDALRRRSWSSAGFLLIGLVWSLAVASLWVRSSESRKVVFSELVTGLKWLRGVEAKPVTGSHRFDGIELAVLLSFLLVAVGYQLGRVQSEPPYALLTGDAANLAGFAAGLDHPEFFAADPVLGHPEIYAYYATVQVPLLRALTRLTGDYGASFLSLLGIHVLLQAFGFYLLGRLLFGNRYWAWLLAMVTLVRVDLNLAEYWGIHRHAVARLTFQALLPYFLAAAYYWRSRPFVWPWLMVGAGVLMYVHPASIPPFGLAVWMGFVLYLPKGWGFGKSAGYLFLMGGIFLLVSSPFLLVYLGRGSDGPPRSAPLQEIPYREIYPIIEARFAEGFLDLPRAVVDFGLLWTDPVRPGGWLFWLWAFLGTGLLWWIRGDRRSLALVATWLLGLLLVSTVIPFIDYQVARARETFPLQYDLIRGLRFLIPFLLLFCLWPLAEISRKTRGTAPGRTLVPATGVLGAALVAVWVYWHPPDALQDAVACWGEGRVACGEPGWPASFEALDAVRRLTPIGAPILATDLELQIRYYSLRPMVYCYKDGGVFAMAAHYNLLQWNEHKRRLSGALYERDPATRLERLIELGRALEARYLLLTLPQIQGLSPKPPLLVWENQSFALLAIAPRDREGNETPDSISNPSR